MAHGPGSACLTQVVRVLPKPGGGDRSAHLIEALGKAGYEVRGSYLPIHLLSQFESFVRGRLPRTERVWADLVELPCEPEVSVDHVERIAANIIEVLKKGVRREAEVWKRVGRFANKS
ncbi:MAG: hypothetical protein GTO64_03960 [Candidatus Latescibacteria bacterium]|nr:hypothetical protein [Candidatus Latescibacterota bacterium]NIT01545.1 hypothetical protein [Candidatus Latescibacterota bacterium]NIT38444.1 hypothetical protein [Candidatus Latescibacterota bacterium]